MLRWVMLMLMLMLLMLLVLLMLRLMLLMLLSHILSSLSLSRPLLQNLRLCTPALLEMHFRSVLAEQAIADFHGRGLLGDIH